MPKKNNPIRLDIEPYKPAEVKKLIEEIEALLAKLKLLIS